MQNDLISKSDLLEALRKEADECEAVMVVPSFWTALRIVKERPITYDVEKVVERLDQLEDDANTEYRGAKVGQAERSMDYYDGLEEAYRNAKYLVSNAGKEE